MSFIPKKPEKAVLVVLARITKAKEHVERVLNNEATATATHNNEFISMFLEIDEKLKAMTESMSKIKTWEMSLVERFCALERVLDDSIFCFKDREFLSQVPRKLREVNEDLAILKDLVSTAEQSHRRRRDMIDGGRRPGEWVGVKLVIENKIMKSEAISLLCESFDRLEWPQLRTCLISLSVFPEDSSIKKRTLIYWWIGEGFVADEDMGEKVFQDILNEGFMRPTNNKSSFIFYPWVRRMLLHIAQSNGFLQFSDGPHRTPRNSRRRVFDINKQFPNDAHVLTVFNINQQHLRTQPEWLSRLHKVEVLQMGRWQDSTTHHIEANNHVELLKGLGSQKHLKYLSLRGISRIESLPQTIGSLVSLQILDLKACHNLGKLPRTISQLRSLTHLDLSECYLLDCMPRGIQRLLNLQVLKGFLVGNDGCKIADMEPLSKLRKLSLRMRSSQGRDQLGSLDKLSPTMRTLTISWTGTMIEAVSVAKLPASLTKLDLRCVPFEAVPEWMHPDKLPNLVKLYIKGGNLQSLDQNLVYENVKFARLQYLKHLKLQQQQLVASFPHYLNLERTNCHKDYLDLILIR